jgi:beta-phosphoglucomutase
MLSLPQIRAVLLDLDGLMIDSEPIYRLAWQSAAAALGYEFPDALYLNVIGLNDRDSEGVLIRTFGSGFPVDQFRALWPRRWRRHVEENGMPVKPGLEDLFQVLDAHRLPAAVATSSDGEQAAFSLRAAGLDRRFACIVTGDQVANGKPAPDIFLRGAGRLSVSPRQCMVFEDSDVGILAASAAGIPAVLIPDLKAPSAEAAALAYRIFGTLQEAAAFIKVRLANQNNFDDFAKSHWNDGFVKSSPAPSGTRRAKTEE